MSDSLDVLLTDEFVLFSQNIAEVVKRRRAKQDELKEVYDRIKGELKLIDDEARNLQQEWEAFKASKTTEN